MSGCSYDSSCPNCGDNVSEYSDHKPFAITVIGPCLSCGFFTTVDVNYYCLEELNEAREEHNKNNELEGEDLLLPLTELPEQDKTL